MMSNHLELLAPAGDWESLQAALDAGASAVYLGLTTLNARRRAKNFRQEEFVRAVETAQARGARVYLTLNIDLSERELGQAARMLELARQCRADAVLVRDPALLAMRPHYPELEFHFSTQTSMTNSADVAAAGELGAARVVLAREMTLSEIAAVSSVVGVQTEVFCQGALCFSISGRCLLSSWAGGHSGNRGACTSPCRVPWTIAGRAAGTPLSMRDLTTVQRLDELRAAGVTALKIEGRLKNAAWVRRAVGLYRRALAGEITQELLQEVEDLGAYTGRTLTGDYLDGKRGCLTGEAGREPAPSSNTVEDDANSCGQEPAEEDDIATENVPSPHNRGLPPAAINSTSSYTLEVTIEEKGIACRCQCGETVEEWRMPKTVVRRAHKAVAVGDVLERLAAAPLQGHRLEGPITNAPEFLLVPRAAGALIDRVAAAIRHAAKPQDDMVRIDLPSAVRAVLEKTEPNAENCLSLGEQPDRARLDAKAAGVFLKNVQPEAVIVEGVWAGNLARVLSACGRAPMIVALPPVLFEDDLPKVKRLLKQCAKARLTVEVNSWGGWRLARAAGARMEGGPGLAVLNSLAARVLAQCDLTSVTLSPEADRRKMEEMTAHCPAPCSLVVFGRPALVTTRVELSEEEFAGQILEDRRGVRLKVRRENGLWVLRPVEPFDLRGCQNDRIRARHLVVDLVGSDDPAGDWYDVPLPKSRRFLFNYDRTLT
jgi:U32 family peptidase